MSDVRPRDAKTTEVVLNEQEVLYIGDRVRVVVLNLNRLQVRLGFTAPPELPVYREEIYKRIQLEKKDR
jgi:carbon storage regulator